MKVQTILDEIRGSIKQGCFKKYSDKRQQQFIRPPIPSYTRSSAQAEERDAFKRVINLWKKRQYIEDAIYKPIAVKQKITDYNAFQKQFIKIVPPNDVGWWWMGEKEGTILHDLTDYSNDGTINGATWVTLPSGKNALSFDGVSNYCRIAHSYPAPTGLTMSLWVKYTGLTGNYQFPLNSDPEAVWRVGINKNGNLYFDAGSHNDIATAIPVSIGEFHYIVITSQNRDVNYDYKAYIDNNLVISGTVQNQNINAVGELYIGNNPYVYYWTKGLIADVRVYNRALSADEIARIYNNTKAYYV